MLEHMEECVGESYFTLGLRAVLLENQSLCRQVEQTEPAEIVKLEHKPGSSDTSPPLLEREHD